MKLTTLAVALTIASTAFAKSCNRGGVYCGQSLLNRGKYRDHIVETLKGAGQPTSETHVQNSIFACLADGDIRYRGYCTKGCGGVGSTDPDYCL